ncbi:MAG: peptidase S8 and S53 subtilisin kexin sedolisin [Gammaproteobacteria bacterium]|nr:peptidase S8 and S53 subtilisin kexin sedolisin [Gammaproteobacteria bacterium]
MSARRGPVRIGLLDGGIAPDVPARVVARKRFTPVGGARPAGSDAFEGSRHGNEMARLLGRARAEIGIVSADVLGEGTPVAPEQVVAGLEWLAGQGVRLISMSLGLLADRPRLREAVASLAAEGIVLLASAPARGRPVFPAAYPEVVAVMGDARCHDPEYSHLGTPRAEFGASTLDSRGRPSGASFAVPRIAARLAERLAEGLTADLAVAALRRDATYHGPERIPGSVAAPAGARCGVGAP